MQDFNKLNTLMLLLLSQLLLLLCYVFVIMFVDCFVACISQTSLSNLESLSDKKLEVRRTRFEKAYAIFLIPNPCKMDILTLINVERVCGPYLHMPMFEWYIRKHNIIRH